MPAARVISFEVTARATKARKLADALSSVGISESSARLMTAEQWAMVAKCAGCKPPNSEETRQAVYASMLFHDAPLRLSVREWRGRLEAQCQ